MKAVIWPVNVITADVREVQQGRNKRGRLWENSYTHGKKNKVLQSGFKVGAVVKHGGSNRSNFGLNFLHNRV